MLPIRSSLIKTHRGFKSNGADVLFDRDPANGVIGVSPADPLQGFETMDNPIRQISAWQMVPSLRERVLFLTRVSGTAPIAIWCTDVNRSYYENRNQFARLETSPLFPGKSILTISADGNSGMIDVYNKMSDNSNDEVSTAGLILIGDCNLRRAPVFGFDLRINSRAADSFKPQFDQSIAFCNEVWTGQCNVQFFNKGHGGVIEVNGIKRDALGNFDTDDIFQVLFDKFRNSDKETRLIFVTKENLMKSGLGLVNAVTLSAAPFMTIIKSSVLPPANTLPHELGHTLGLPDITSGPFTGNLMWKDNSTNGLSLGSSVTLAVNPPTMHVN